MLQNIGLTIAQLAFYARSLWLLTGETLVAIYDIWRGR